MSDPLRNYTGWNWHSFGWTKTIVITTVIIVINIIASVKWNQLSSSILKIKKLKQAAWIGIGIWIFGIGIGMSNVISAETKDQLLVQTGSIKGNQNLTPININLKRPGKIPN